MKHKRVTRNHPAADVVVGVVLEVVAVTILITEWDTDSFWGTLFRVCLVAGPLPWLWWAFVYLLRGRPDDPLSLYANDPEETDEPAKPSAFDQLFPTGRTVAATDLTDPPQVLVFDQDTMEQITPPAPTKRTFEQTKVSIAALAGEAPPMGPVAGWLTHGAIPKGAVQGAIEQESRAAHAKRLADDLDAAGGSYTGDPRLAPGFWAKQDGESEDDYWQRICGCQGKEDPRHLLCCPRWTFKI